MQHSVEVVTPEKLQSRERVCSLAAARVRIKMMRRTTGADRNSTRGQAPHERAGIHQRLPAQIRRPSGTIGLRWPPLPARSIAFEILLRVEREDSYAAELLHSDRLAKLSSRDHGLATELVMGVLRWQSLLDRRLAAASSQKLERLDGEVLAALRLGVYQLQFLSRVPARAAIFESVELVKAARKRSAASFVNAVLRTIAGSGRGGRRSAQIGRSSDAITLAQNAAHPRGWWNAGPNTMDWKQRGRSAP